MIPFHPRLVLSDNASFNEKYGLLHDFPQVPVEPLRAEHLDYVFETTEAAFKNDPLREYLLAGDDYPVSYSTRKRLWKVRRKHDLKTKFGFVVNGGDSTIIATPPENDISKPSPIDRAIDLIISVIFKGYLSLFTSEQRKRNKEIETKFKEAIEEKLGDRAEEMFHVDSLSTKPEQQGHGFASALVGAVLAVAAKQRRSVYLFSSAVANIPFYESCGFVRVGHLSLGGENPKWEKPPLIIALMVWETK